MQNNFIKDFVADGELYLKPKGLNFAEAVKETLNELPYNVSITENGAIGYKSSGRALVDINYMTSSLRKKTDKELINLFQAAYYENSMYAWKWLFFLRDIRGGMGERYTFRRIIKYMADFRPHEMALFIPYIAEYGRYDDTWVLLDTQLNSLVIKMINAQLQEDIKNYTEGKPISLLAKWMPKRNAESHISRHYARLIIEGLKLDDKTYNRMLVKLRKKLNLVESLMCANQWSAIDYNSVPSKANLLYRNAFLKHDPERRQQYLEDLTNGKEGVKINASTNFPHDVVHQYVKPSRYGWRYTLKKYDETLEQLWKNQKDTVQSAENIMVIQDGSGSMYQPVDGNSSVQAEEVATALSIYFAERCAGQFHNRFMTFGARPRFVDINNCQNLQEKIEVTLKNTDCSNTNIEAVFKLLLNTAIKNNMKQSDLPKTLLMISDMEFDFMVSGRTDKAMFEDFAKEYERYGYKLPRLVFWNICSRTGTIPIRENSNGVALVSGYSVNIMNMVLSNELDPYKCLLKQLNTERYQIIEDKFKELEEKSK